MDKQDEKNPVKSQGTVRNLNERGFGFIQPTGVGPNECSSDIFFFCKDVVGDYEFNDLYKGMMVTYEIGRNRDGRSKAINVTVVQQ